MTIKASGTDLAIADVSESEVWDISFFEDFRIRLVNKKGEIKIIDMAEWKKRNK